MDFRNKRITKLNKEITGFINANSKKGLSQAIFLQNAWEKIAPPKTLEYTDNIAFSHKTKQPEVLVYVESSHWAAELEAQKEWYRLLLEKETGLMIPDVKFLVTKKAAYKKMFIKKDEKNTEMKTSETALPLSEEEENDLLERVAQIKNQELREKLYFAAKADLEWKKGIDWLKLSENPPESPETI